MAERYDLREFRTTDLASYSLKQIIEITEQIDALALSLSCCFHDGQPLADRDIWWPLADATQMTSKALKLMQAKAAEQEQA